ncbi:MAG: hypothetical protein M3396_06085 [Actinomycetota bacterium]|nr:hypothetical protein [Actinomycetota bacterium]MDQ3573486.1 hypothetical protein [Actinomycetota bacterium]
MGTMNGTPVIGVLLSTMVLFGIGWRPALAQVSQLNGSAYGAFAKVSVFGGPPNQVGAAPVAVLPKTGGNEARARPELIAQVGPATIFGGKHKEGGRAPSGELKVSTKGETGPGGFVTSDASVVNVGPGPLIADKLSSTCTANEGGVTGSATIDKGVLETKYDPGTQEPTKTEALPEKPAPNTAMEGTLDHVGDRFRMVFNEQVVKGDTITVRAAHMYFFGPIAVGEMVVGQSVCGLSADDGSTAPPTTAPDPNASPSTEPAATVPPDPELSAEAAESESGGDGGPLLIGALAVAAAAGLAALIAFKRRRRRPT